MYVTHSGWSLDKKGCFGVVSVKVGFVVTTPWSNLLCHTRPLMDILRCLDSWSHRAKNAAVNHACAIIYNPPRVTPIQYSVLSMHALRALVGFFFVLYAHAKGNFAERFAQRSRLSSLPL